MQVKDDAVNNRRDPIYDGLCSAVRGAERTWEWSTGRRGIFNGSPEPTGLLLYYQNLSTADIRLRVTAITGSSLSDGV